MKVPRPASSTPIHSSLRWAASQLLNCHQFHSLPSFDLCHEEHAVIAVMRPVSLAKDQEAACQGKHRDFKGYLVFALQAAGDAAKEPGESSSALVGSPQNSERRH